MKIAIVGLGGIGGYIGARLCKTYTSDIHKIAFIQRGKHLEEIQKHGLKYITKEETITHPWIATASAQDVGVCDFVYFSVKSRDLINAAQENAALIDANTIILTTLNGVNNAQKLAQLFPNNRVINGCIYVSAHIASPGVVKQVGGTGNLFFGPESGDIEPFRAIEQLLVDAGIKAVLTANVKDEVWKKYVFISSWASISSCYAIPIGEILATKNMLDEWIVLIQEIIDLAKTQGIQLPINTIDSCIERAKIIPYENKTSMQLDVEKNNKPELDIFTEYVIEQSKKAGLQARMHEKMLSGIKNRLK